MPASDLCSILDVKAIRKGNTGYTGYDDLLKQAIKTASNLARAFCRRQFDSAAYVEKFRLTQRSQGCGVIVDHRYVKESPITVAPVVTLAGFNGLATATPLAATSVIFDPDTGRVEFEYATEFADPYNKFNNMYMQIAYTGGYSVGTSDPEKGVLQVPDDIRQAVALQSGAMLTRLLDRTTTTSKTRIAPEQVPFSSSGEGIVPQARTLLMRHRRMLIGNT